MNVPIVFAQLDCSPDTSEEGTRICTQTTPDSVQDVVVVLPPLLDPPPPLLPLEHESAAPAAIPAHAATTTPVRTRIATSPVPSIRAEAQPPDRVPLWVSLRAYTQGRRRVCTPGAGCPGNRADIRVARGLLSGRPHRGMRVRVRVPVSLIVAVSVRLAASAPAHAQEAEAPPAWNPHWPTSADDEADRLGRFLEQERAAELRQYWAVAIGGLSVGAPQIALGAYMSKQSDVAAQAIGPGMIIGGSVDCLLGIAPLLAPTPMSILRDLYATERASGKPADQVVHDVEDKWRELVTRQRLGRMIGGIFDLVVGVPAFTTGLVFALAKPGLAGMSSQTQYGWAGALVGFDFAIYQGIIAIVAPPPVDTAFDTYQLLRHGTTPGTTTARVGFVPVAGGGAVTVGVSFR